MIKICVKKFDISLFKTASVLGSTYHLVAFLYMQPWPLQKYANR